ncbi:unnamed protein product [Victoria cruziana]
MVNITPESVLQFKALMDQVDESLKETFANVHQGNLSGVLLRFLKAREGHVLKAHKMLLDCLNWRVQNKIDEILTKPITPRDRYKAVRDSQLIGMSGYSKQGLPVFGIGVGLSTFDKASVHYYVQSHIQLNEYRDRVVFPTASKKHGRHIGSCLKILDMTGLRISALNHLKLLTIIATIDDLNYPEKTETYYIVNAPYIFSACWKVVKPLLQERTRRKIQVLQGCGRDELLEFMDYASLPHFCRNEGSGSSRHCNSDDENCFSLDHNFHQEMYDFMKRQSSSSRQLESQGSIHVDFPQPDPDGSKIVKTIESEFQKIEGQNSLPCHLDSLKINGDRDCRNRDRPTAILRER